MDIDTLMSKHSDNYRFHGVRAATLSRLIAQSEDGELTLWGRTPNSDGTAGYTCGRGELSVTDITGLELSYNEFCDEGGVVLVLERLVDEPVEEDHESERREHRVRVEEWHVIGGLRPVFDEDGDVVEEEAFSLDEVLNGEF